MLTMMTCTNSGNWLLYSSPKNMWKARTVLDPENVYGWEKISIHLGLTASYLLLMKEMRGLWSQPSSVVWGNQTRARAKKRVGIKL